MNKICTTVKQSRKFIKLGIDINTADMYYMYRHWEIDENTVGSQSDARIGFSSDFYYGADNGKNYHYIPSWSLTALLGLLCRNNSLVYFDGMYNMVYGTEPYYTSPSYSNPLSAAFEMICWLKKNNKL